MVLKSIIAALLLTSGCLFAADFVSHTKAIELSLKDTWRHDHFLGERFFSATVDSKGRLIGQFMASDVFVATEKSIEVFAPRGQGPHDVQSAFGVDMIGDDIAVIDHRGLIKVFEDTDVGYKSKHLDVRGKAGQFVDGLSRVNDYWIVGGVAPARVNERVEIDHLRLYDQQGDIQDTAIRMPHDGLTAYQFLDYFMVHHVGALLFLRETELVVHQVSLPGLEVTPKRLKPPSGYKPPSDGVYHSEKLFKGDLKNNLIDARTSYSSISNVVKTDDFLVVQIRSAQDHLPIFTTLFYKLNDFSLVDWVRSDDFLVAAHQDQLYTLRHGAPGYDDEAGEFILDIHAVSYKNQKQP